MLSRIVVDPPGTTDTNEPVGEITVAVKVTLAPIAVVEGLAVRDTTGVARTFTEAARKWPDIGLFTNTLTVPGALGKTIPNRAPSPAAS